MTVGELIAALSAYSPDLPVELKAYCCGHTHPIKVEVEYAELEPVDNPTVAKVVISDESIRWYDDPSEAPPIPAIFLED